MTPFNLEDFFDEYEHCPELINLASSDALPWSAGDLWAGDRSLAEVAATFYLPIPTLSASCFPD
jgi:hypothetical protein